MLSTLQTIEYKQLNEIFKDDDVEIFDYIPGDGHDLYIVIGDVEAEKFNSKTFEGYQVTSHIYVYAIEKSQIKLKNILQKIHDRFKNIELECNSYYIEYFNTQTFSSTRIDVDMVQGLIEINYRVEEI